MIQLIKSLLNHIDVLRLLKPTTAILTLTRNVEKFDVVERIVVPVRIKM